MKEADWNILTQVREEVTFSEGRIIRGQTAKRGKTKHANYILYYKTNVPIALIEAKDNTHNVGSGMQQALEYADFNRSPLFTAWLPHNHQMKHF